MKVVREGTYRAVEVMTPEGERIVDLEVGRHFWRSKAHGEPGTLYRSAVREIVGGGYLLTRAGHEEGGRIRWEDAHWLLPSMQAVLAELADDPTPSDLKLLEQLKQRGW